MFVIQLIKQMGNFKTEELYVKWLKWFCIITFFQVMIIVFWGTKKANLYWDEFYTLEGAHYFSSYNSEEHYIDEDPGFKVGEWFPVSFVKDTLIVGEEETLLKEPFADVLKKLTGGHNYSAFLNIAESIISRGKFSIWPSIILNVCFFILNQIFLFALCRKWGDDSSFALAVCALYGFCSMCVSMAVFIRCYMLATFLITLFTYLHFACFDIDGEEIAAHIKRCIMMLLSFGTLYIAHNVAQYSVIYGGIFIILYSVVLFAKKGIKRGLLYSLPTFGGGLFYLFTQTEYLSIIFDFENAYLTADQAMKSTLDGIIEFKLSFLPDRLFDMAHIMGRYIFGSFYGMLIFIAAVLVVALIHVLRKKKDENSVSISSFFIVPSTAALLYITAFTVFGLYAQVRYISFVFPELAIVVMIFTYKNIRNFKYKYAIVTLLVLMVTLSVNLKGKVDMVYAEDRESIERIRAFDANSFLMRTENHKTFITYETAFIAEDDAELYVYDNYMDESYDNLKKQLRDKMILVGYYGVSTEDLQEFLRDNGYQVDWLADTYNNVFFTAVR